MINTKELIDQLVSQCEPITPLELPFTRFAKWAALTLLILIASVAALNPPVEIWSNVATPSFVLPAVAMLGLAIVSSLSAFALAIPNVRHPWFSVIPVSSVLLCFLLTASVLTSSESYDTHPSFACVLRIVGLAAIPAVLLFQMLRKAAPFRSEFIGLLATLGALSFSGIAIQFLCLNLSGIHILLWHFLPICVLAIGGAVLGRIAFRNGYRQV